MRLVHTLCRWRGGEFEERRHGEAVETEENMHGEIDSGSAEGGEAW
jgi:hypothetical protein